MAKLNWKDKVRSALGLSYTEATQLEIAREQAEEKARIELVIKMRREAEAKAEAERKAAEAAKAKNISAVVFDRSGYLYHGRVQALAEAARENGLEF